MTTARSIGLIIGLIIAILIYNSIYVVTEGQQALLISFGKIQNNSQTKQPLIINPGLHFKLPLVTQARIFDTRLQSLDIKSSNITTSEQKNLTIYYYVKWRINNLPVYFKRTGGDIIEANNLLEQQFSGDLRTQLGNHTLADIIANNRATIMAAINQQALTQAQALGITLIDARIKKVELSDNEYNDITKDIQVNLENKAASYREAGSSDATLLRIKADANANLTIAKAREQAATIRGEGDAQATKIYADAYNQDPSFYAFSRSLEAYKKIFDNKHQNNFLILKPDNQIFKYFNSTGPSAEQKR